MKVRGLIHTIKESYFSTRYAEDVVKVIIEDFCYINVRIAHFSSSFQCGYTNGVCSFWSNI